MALWFIIPPLILGLGLYYLGKRLLAPFGLGPRQRRLAWTGVGFWGIILIASLALSRIETPFDTILSWIGYLSMGLLSTLFFLMIARDVIWGITRLAASLGRSARMRATEAGPPADESRRRHLLQLTNLAVVGAAAAVTSYGFYEARRRPGIVRITVPIRNLPAAFDGFRIVQVTDLHAGLTVGREWIETVAEEAAAIGADMIAFTGDLADGSVSKLRNVVAPMGDLRAPAGAYFITGNHEYYSDASEWVREARRLGYDVLLNEHRIIERNGARLVLAGITDFTGGNFMASHRSEPARAFQDAPDGLARILLAHQPKSLRQTSNVPFDLMLSGHTHGGQFFPWNLATAADQPYLSGLHRPDGKWIYVSKGTGYWGPPVRLGARSEITVITLTAERIA